MKYYLTPLFKPFFYSLNLMLWLIISSCDAYEMGFNCGASGSTKTRDGRYYARDQKYSNTTKAGYIGGYAVVFQYPLKSGGTRDYDLYSKDRRGFSEYRFDVLNGAYIVKLHFNETQHHWYTLRVFDVWIEGKKVLEDFDIFDEVERNYAIDYQFATVVKDGQLNITAKATKGETLLSGIYVFSRAPDTVAPSKPRKFSAMDGYKQVILDWLDNPEDDIAHYNVYRSDGGNFIRIANAPTSRYIDNAVEEHRIYNYYVRAVDIYHNEGERTQILSAMPYSKEDSALCVYELFVAESDMIYLSNHALDNEYIPVVFRHQGVEYMNAQMRYRGGVRRRETLKPNLKILFDDDELFRGRKKINLLGDSQDSSLMRSKLAFDLHRLSNVLAPAADWVHLELNGKFIGVYTDVDQIDERFLSINGRDPTGNIYKPNDFLRPLPDEEAYRTLYEKETNEGGGYSDLIEFIELINLTPDNLIREALWEVLDVEEYLDWYCVNQLISNWDIAGHNYYLYHALNNNKWEIIAWDLDLSFYEPEMPIDICTKNNPMLGVPVWWGRLLDRVLSVPQFRRMYCLRLIELMEKEFSDEAMFARLEEAYNRILFDAERDIRKKFCHENDVGFYTTLDKMKDFVSARRKYLRSVVYDYMPPATVNLFINEIMANNKPIGAGGKAGESWIELYNWGKENTNLGGLYLSDGVTKWKIPDIAIPPNGYMRFWADEEDGERHTNFTLDATGGFIGLFDGNKTVDAITFPAQNPNTSYGRIPDGGSRWNGLQTPTPGAKNGRVVPVVILSKPDVGTQRIVKGESVTHHLLLKNQTDTEQNFDIWIDLFLPDIYPRNPIFESRQLRIPPNDTSDEAITFLAPTDVPPGISYKYDIKVGLEGDVWETLAFELAIFSDDAKAHLYINEFMAASQRIIADEFGEYDDWVELYNAGEVPINLAGVYLSDDLREKNKWRIPDVEVVPGGYVLFWADGDEEQGKHHTSFKLSASGEEIGLFDTDENGNATIDRVVYGPQKNDMSYGRYPDGDECFECFSKPTPNNKNVSSGCLHLYINEFMAYADEEGGHDDWIEIYSAGCVSINMGGMYFSDNAAKWSVPDIVIPPDSCLLFRADGDDVEQHTNFKLNPNGGTIGLFDADGKPIDVINYGIQQKDISLGRYPNGTGAWRSFFNPTPGAKNAISKLLYINEIMADNMRTIADEAGEYDDWIEIYNQSDEPIAIGGMYLSDDMSDRIKWRMPQVNIPAGGYLLLWADNDENQGALHTDFKLNAGGETIVLFDTIENANALIDAIDFGAQRPDISYGRYPDGGSVLDFFAKPTPGAPNASERILPIVLQQNYPNPFNMETWIPYKLIEPADIVISIYDVSGRLVRRFNFDSQPAGEYLDRTRAIRWDGRNDLGERVACGVYFYSLQSRQYAVTRKLAVQR